MMILSKIAYPAIINLESSASVYGGARANASTERTLFLQLKGKNMSRTPDSRLRHEGFRKAEASLRLEGMDPSGTPLYESVKARIISGELTYEQGRSEIFAYYTKSDTAGPVTVGEMLTEEFLKPLSMSHDELAEAIGVCKQDIEDIICGLRRLTDDEARVLADIFGTDEDFWSNLQKLQDRKKRR
ncbi:HigA family addiction module antitoxin [Cronobacter dublinensis]